MNCSVGRNKIFIRIGEKTGIFFARKRSQSFTPSVHHVCMSAVSLHTVPAFFISFIPSPSMVFCSSFLLPPSAFLSFCLPFITFPHPLLCILSFACSPSSHTLNLHIFFLSFRFFLFCFHPPRHPPFPLWMYCPGGVADACLPGFWGAAGVCNDHGKTYALYAITVFRRNQDGSEDCWKTYRRYSDFHDFHMRITEQVWVSYYMCVQQLCRGQQHFYPGRKLTPQLKHVTTPHELGCHLLKVSYLFCFSLKTWHQSSSCRGKRPSTTWTETSWRREKKTSMLTYRLVSTRQMTSFFLPCTMVRGVYQ